MRLLLVAATFVLAVVLSACIEIERQIEVTPGTVPPQLEGARWPDIPIPFCIVRHPEGGFVDHDTFVALTLEAMDRWGVPTSYEGDCPGPLEIDNGLNEISWADLAQEGDDLTKAGNTNIRYRTTPLGGPPDITEADVMIDRTPPSGKDTSECLFTTLLHETGHFFGLHHLDVGTVMSPVIVDCLEDLTEGDIAAIEELY